MIDPTGDSSESERLLNDVATGSARAVDDLFARHRSYLRRVIDMRLDWNLRRRVDASDIVQETHIEMLRRLDDFLTRRPVSFRVWLRQVAQERLIMARRRHLGAECRAATREVPLPDHSSQLLLDKFGWTAATPSQNIRQLETARLMRQLIAEMDEQDREVLLMRYVEGLNNQEIGFVLEMEANTVCKRHGRALLRLRQLLQERDGSAES